MDFIEEFIGSQGTGLIDQLTGSGFGIEQAEKFLPEAGESIIGAMKGMDVQSLLDSSISEQTSSLLGNIDVTSLASRVGVDTSLAHGGLEKLIPVAMNFLKNNEAAAGFLGLGSLAGMAKGLFN